MTHASHNRSDDSTDDHFMRKALELAQLGQGWVEPNPMVGCVIVRDGQLIGSGYHQRFGGPHAEVEALRSLESLSQARGATAYVTLEPCCHHGKTPPCANALIDAGVARVVVAIRDPFPQVDGGGIERLIDAGITVDVGVLKREAEQQSAPYLKKVRTGFPWVIAKWAMTVDGKIATTSGASQWITGPAARQHAHRLRARVDAIAVGMGTVVGDDPLLTARLDHGAPPRLAARVVFCRRTLPAVSSQLVQSATSSPLLLITGNQIAPDDLGPLRDLGVGVVSTETDDPVQMVRDGLLAIDSPAVPGGQGGQGGQRMTNLMLEGGGQLIGSFFSADQIDECHVYVGAKVFGGHTAPGPVGGRGTAGIGDAWQANLMSVDQLDDDLIAVYRRR